MRALVLSTVALALSLFAPFAPGQTQFAALAKQHLPKYGTGSVALGDVDRDGDIDLVTASPSRLYLNDGRGKFTDAPASGLADVFTSTVEMGDVDGDGDLDLVVGNSVASQNRLYLNDGKGKFTDVTTTHLPKVNHYTHALALGDVDGDGDLDLVVGNTWQNFLYLNDGNGKFTDATSCLPKVSDTTKALALGDVDGDGDLDLVVGNAGQNRLYLNDKGKFTDATASRLPKDSNAADVALGDVDKDGDLDLVLASWVGRQNRLYLNLHRHVYSPLLAQLAKAYQLDYYAKPGYATATQVAVPFMNLAPQQPPIKVPRFGLFGLSLVGLIVLPPVGIAFPKGRTSVAFTFPNIPALVGKTLYVQALTVHRATPVDAHFTNVIADPISR